jgi:hypothetical protein
MWAESYTKALPCMDSATLFKRGAVLTDAMIEGTLPGFSHLVFADLAAARQVKLRDRLSPEDRKRLESVADLTAGAWLDALPVSSSCVVGDGDVVSSLRYMRKTVPPLRPTA